MPSWSRTLAFERRDRRRLGERVDRLNASSPPAAIASTLPLIGGDWRFPRAALLEWLGAR
jgi:hypothetical protein